MGVVFCIVCIFASTVSFCANQDDLLVIVQNGKYGYINHRGKIVIPPQFIWAEDFWNGYGTAYVCGRYVSMDAKGTIAALIPRPGLHAQKSGEKFGFVNASGQFKIKPIFDDVLPFSEGLAAIQLGDKWGFVNNSGHIVIQPQFESAYYFEQGIGNVELYSAPEAESNNAFINKSGKVIAQGFQFSDFIAEGRIPVLRNEQWGYLNLRGKTVIPFRYDSASRFSEGLAAVEKDKKWEYIDRHGRTAIPFKFDKAGSFASGLAPVKLGAKTGFINKSGKFSFYLPFSQAAGFLTGQKKTGLFIANSDVSRFWTDDHKFGYVNTSGTVIWGPSEESPDHPPIFGWTDEEKAQSCVGISESLRDRIKKFPE
jgi:hypothetical protein